MINKQSYQITGMRQDNLVGTGFSSKFAHEIKNLRLNTIGDYTAASWTTERGTKYMTVHKWTENNIEYAWITDETYRAGGLSGNYTLGEFQPIGQAVINDNWILFGIAKSGVVEDEDAILCLNFYKSSEGESLRGRVLYWGNLNFDVNHPIETTVFYENESIQKVYWTDGLNQPRMINIKGANDKQGGFDSTDATQFDFVRELNLTENLSVNKIMGGGMFPPGTVKYAITYYKENGQESNIVTTSTLFYPIKVDRGCSPDELSSDSFKVTVNGIVNDTLDKWDYIRLYSIIRTSDNATPIVRIVEDKNLNTAEPLGSNNYFISFIDTNTAGRIVDPNIIFYLGGRNCSVETIEQKDNVLFYGNIKLKNKSAKALGLTLENKPIFYIDTTNVVESQRVYKEIDFAPFVALPTGTNKTELGLYHWVNQLNDTSQNPKIFKYNETYKVGIQFQDKYGVWSDILPLGSIKNNTDRPTSDILTSTKFPKIKFELKSGDVKKLRSNGYLRARLACCYPNNSNREVLAQGVLCPTLANEKWKNLHSPDAISSWFYRFREPYLTSYAIEGDGNDARISLGEVQSNNIHNGRHGDISGDSVFKLCWDICTFHSPDVEFDESLQKLIDSNVKLRFLGYSEPHSRANKLYLEYSKKAYDYIGNSGDGLDDKGTTFGITLTASGIENLNATYDYDKNRNYVGVWKDINVYNSNFLKHGSSSHQLDYDQVPFTIYPFQRKYLNNFVGTTEITIAMDAAKDAHINIEESSIIDNKIWSTLNFSLFNNVNKNQTDDDLIDIADCKIFNSSELISEFLKISDKKEKRTYFGNVDSLAPLSNTIKYASPVYEYQGLRYHNFSYKNVYYPSTVDLSAESDETEGGLNKNTKLFRGRYDIESTLDRYHDIRTTDIHSNVHIDYINVSFGVTSDPIQIKYKSTPHLVLSFDNSTAIKLRKLCSPEADIINHPDHLLLVELYRDKSPQDTSDKNSLNDIYVPCSTSYKIPSTNTAMTLYHDEGDTYYMRYDNLKTYPYSDKDVNQIVEIYSFMCETRINLDGRYDENRGLTDNTIVDNTNFNLINKSYTQTDNLFSYTELDPLSSKLDNFPNQISFSNPKSPGEEVDAWTNITLASTLDVNGNLGQINRIENINDNLILFQDHGIARIKYNESTAIPTTNGEPLELAKTNKLDGVDYVSTSIGCQNKWSISNTKNGLFWIDDSRQELMTYNGQSIDSFSPLVGMESFMIKNLPSIFKKWNPNSFEASNFVTYYDKLSNDIYYINKDYCLAWNEEAKTFTSFYDYNGVTYMANIGNHSLMWYDANTSSRGIYAAREADTYSNFFDIITPDIVDGVKKYVHTPIYKDYWMTLVCDGQTNDGSAFPADKVFNNIEYRADIFNLNDIIATTLDSTKYNTSVFNIKHVWNGYQDSQEVSLDAIRKFNTWRVQLPRNVGTKDRIRNPFCYIKLKQNQEINTQTDRMILHDLAVYFDIQ